MVMKTFEIITIFPRIFESYFGESIIKRAQKDNLIKLNIHNLRDWTTDKHHKVDDTPYGGGAGMVLRIEPIWRCVQSISSASRRIQFPTLPTGRQVSKQFSNSKISKLKKTRVILFSAKGKIYTQKDARRLLKYDNLILICGRYEGVDERVTKHIADEEISIGEYVLTGGEIPAMVLVDSIARLIPGVLGNPQSIVQESFSKDLKDKNLEYSQYTKPDDFQGWKVPKVLLCGNHEKIEEWRAKNSKSVK